MADRLEEIEARLAATTAGVWVAGVDFHEDEGYWSGAEILAVDETPVPGYRRSDPDTEEKSETVSKWADEHYRGMIAETHNYFSIPDAEHDANQAFMAHAHQDVPWLIEQVRLARADADRLAEIVETIEYPSYDVRAAETAHWTAVERR